MEVAAQIAEALAPFAPANSSVHAAARRSSFNDDDVYVIDVRSKQVIKNLGCKTSAAECARRGDGHPVKVGQAVMTGMQARSFGAWY